MLQKEEAENICYYFQDELGSPIRLMDKNGELAESYGYDEFGQDLYRDREETAGRSMTGSCQPFGYTGYQYDKTAGTYYAQVREYLPEIGRFIGEDWGEQIVKYKEGWWEHHILPDKETFCVLYKQKISETGKVDVLINVLSLLVGKYLGNSREWLEDQFYEVIREWKVYY